MKKLLCLTLTVVSVVTATAQNDVRIQNLSFSPTTIETLTNPDHILFDLLNYGPGVNCGVDVELIFSTNAVAGDGDDRVLGPVRHIACVDPLYGIHDQLSGPENAQLTIPADLAGTYHVFMRVSPSPGPDPDPTDNTAAFPNPVTILPNQAPLYAVMANASMVLSNMDVILEGDFAYNEYYGNNWRITAPGGGFTMTFNVAQAGPYRLRVRHATSFSQSCPNQGYAPVTIMLNGTNVVSQYDVAAHHTNSYWYENDYWLVEAVAGLNTLDWMADDLCTHYWIQRVELMPVIPPRIDSITRTASGQIQLLISSLAGTTNVIEVSTNLVQWSAATNVVNGAGTMMWEDGAPLPGGRRFYRILQLGL